MHNAAFELLKLNYVYLAFDVQPQDLKEALEGLVALGIVGVNVTIPHKEAVIPYLDGLSSEAHAIGAVNTIVNDGSRLSGHNTDVFGLVETLKSHRVRISGDEVSIFGAGGAARAVLYGLISHFRPGVVHLLNRSIERAATLRDFFGKSFGFRQIEVVDLYTPASLEAVSRSKLIVNTTPLGMSPDINDSPVQSDACFKKGQTLVDLVYNPKETRLMKMAKSKGVKTIGGLEILLYQGAKSFELWTNRKMPVDKVRRTLGSYLSNT